MGTLLIGGVRVVVDVLEVALAKGPRHLVLVHDARAAAAVAEVQAAALAAAHPAGTSLVLGLPCLRTADVT